MARRKSGRSRRRTLGCAALGALALIVVLLVAASFLPAERVPAPGRPVHRQLTDLRRRVTGRQAPVAPVPRGALADGDLRCWFAPSPEIVRQLHEFMAGAQRSLDVCVYDLDLEDIVATLAEAQRRGVQVRVMTDTDNLGQAALQPLREGGVPLRGDERKALMHNKFVVADQERVWTGSFNFTHNCAERNDNNAVRVASPELAANYAAEFAEMWDGRFGAKSPANTPHPEVTVKGLRLDNAFAPEDHVMARVISLVRTATSTIDVMAFSFTHRELSAALQERARQGVKVRCLFDRRQASNAYSQDEVLAAAAIDVRLSRNPRGVMHDKVIIVDGQVTLTGSFNFSNSADQENDENILVIHSPEVAAIYTTEFGRCWDYTR